MIRLSIAGDLTLQRQLDVLNMPNRARVKHHRYVARMVIRNAKRNITRQKDVHGRTLPPRKRDNKKVLRKLPKTLKAFVGPKSAKVTWPKTRTGQIARAHQEGVSTTMTAAQAKQTARKRGEPNYSDPATKGQAKALLAAGYRQPTGSRYKSGARAGSAKTRRVSARWITENLTVGKAALILRMLRDEPSKQQWSMPLPEREFFGLNSTDVTDITNHLINDILNDVRRAA
ncbi:hypothetical protein [Oceanobacter sp. 4_MG-2023]|uniref:hypothetical protein n=1 Tax=Oceanobacter sp. 4_MG-2023 TaxID=3062623 RepID=UPI0027325471|nr:hypothetical protein [Oceanobacter sp. 4_MG-2023]MDP2548894.1 hypothetical protein [Oceanobacter sp. 4_MG-2023]